MDNDLMHMSAIKINLRETGRFKPLFLDYVEGKNRLSEFYGLRPQLKQFKRQIGEKQVPLEGRKILTDVLLNLVGFVESEMVRTIKAIKGIEKRLRKAAEEREKTGLRQLDQILERIFPGGDLQERRVNFLDFWLNDQDFLDKISRPMKPLDFVFHILPDDE